MENASKALLMAGGILLTMLIIGLLIFAWGRISEYQGQEDELKNVDDVSKFNLQFSRYDRENVHGYELISLVNKVVNYNNRFSNVQGAKNDEKYKPITMVIDFVDDGKLKSLSYDNNNRLFTTITITQSDVTNQIEKICGSAYKIEMSYRGADVASKLAKSINALILNTEQIQYNISNRGISEENSKKIAVENYKKISKDNTDISYEDMKNKLESSEGSIIKYYEYYQFKKGKFNCKDLSYDSETGRIERIEFYFTGSFE